MKAVQKLEDTINDIKDLTDKFIKRLPIYDMLHDQIEQVIYSKHEINSIIMFIYFIMSINFS